MNSDKNCSEEVIEKQNVPHPVDCKWGEWGKCSATCGSGFQTRKVIQQASHGGNCNCKNKIRRCQNLEKCPIRIDCEWSDWGPCQGFPYKKSCGAGIQKRHVISKGGSPCFGKDVRKCYIRPCLNYEKIGNTWCSSGIGTVADCGLYLYSKNFLRGEKSIILDSEPIFGEVQSMQSYGNCCWDAYDITNRYAIT